MSLLDKAYYAFMALMAGLAIFERDWLILGFIVLLVLSTIVLERHYAE